MNKPKYFIASLLFSFIVLSSFSQDNKSVDGAKKNLQRAIEISFFYTKQSGFSSNQFAVWIENIDGSFIKTIYATKFTAKGGWEKRKTSLPEWVKKSNLPNLTKAEIDTLTSATPSTGELSYIWNCTDKTNKPIADGEYKFFLEANLRGENMVIYSGIIKVGSKPDKAEVKAEFLGNGAEKEKDMISSVKAVYTP